MTVFSHISEVQSCAVFRVAEEGLEMCDLRFDIVTYFDVQASRARTAVF